MHHSQIRFGPLAVLVLMAACNHPPSGLAPAELEIVHPPPALGLPNSPLFDTIVVRAIDTDTREPRRGTSVLWTIAVGNGQVTPIDTRTDSDGLARARWALGAAGLNVLRASTVDAAAVTFSTTGTAFVVDQLVATASTGCGLRDGAPWCWGEGYGVDPIGPSDRQRLGWANTSPVQLEAPTFLADLSLSANSLCALDLQGGAWCADSGTTQLSLVPGLPALRALTAAPDGHVHCGLTQSDSTAWCFVPDSAPPVAVLGGLSFITIRLGQWSRFYEGCGILVDSTAACWATGSLSAGGTLSGVPVPLPGSPHFVRLAKGRGFACGQTRVASLYCWGSVASNLQPYAPTLALEHAGPIGAYDDWIQVMPDLVQWFGFNQLTPTGALQPVPRGLDNLRLLDYAENTLGCILTVEHQVYCLDRFLTGPNSSLSVTEYAPVAPSNASAD